MEKRLKEIFDGKLLVTVPEVAKALSLAPHRVQFNKSKGLSYQTKETWKVGKV